MSIACKCDLSLGAWGTPSCNTVFGVTKRLVFVPNKKSNGSKFSINLTSSTVWTDFQTDLANFDILPTSFIKDVEDVRGDDTFKSYNDGSAVFVRQGQRKFTGYFVGTEGATANLKAELETIRGSKMGVLFVDGNGSLVGKSANGDVMEAIQIDTNTFTTKLIKATDSDPQMLMISFEMAISEKDEQIAVIDYRDITINLLDTDLFKSPYRGYLKQFNANETAGSVAISFRAGTVANCPISDVEIANLSLLNKTTGLPVTILTLTEDTPDSGLYSFTYASQTLLDKLELGFVANNDFFVKAEKVTTLV